MVDAATLGFLQVLGVGVVVGTILILLFSYLRPKVPDVYNHRRLLNTWKSYNNFNVSRVGVTEPAIPDTFFGWISATIATTEDEIIQKIGLDAAVFLRYLRTCLHIVVILALLGAVILMPTYGTAGNKNLPETDDQFVEGLRVISLANVPSSDSRMWATVIIDFFVAFVVVYFMRADYKHYAMLRRKYRTSENPVNYTLVVFDVPEESRNEAAIRDRFELMVPGQISEVVIVRQCSKANKLQKKLDKAITKREVAEYVASVKEEAPQHRPGVCGCCLCFKPKVDSVEFWTAEQDKLENELREQGTLADPCNAVIVIMSNKRAAALLAQANMASDSSEWNVVRAAEPSAIHWPAFSIPGYQADVRRIAVLSFIIVFTLFWTIPATFIAGLFNLEQLTSLGAFEWLDFVLDWSEGLRALIQGALPPIVMSVLISLIPLLFRTVVSLERNISAAVIEMKTRDYFYFFTIYGSFFVIVLGAAVLEKLQDFIDEPASIVRNLASGVPGNGIFFATFIVLQTFIPIPLQLSGVVRVILRAILLKMAKTERQKRKARCGGSLFQYFRYFGQAMLIMYISIVFATMSPFVTLMSVAYFAVGYLAFKYMLLYSTYAPWDGGGNLFTGAYWGTMIGLILQQIIVIGVLGLKEAPAQSIISAIPLVLTLAATVWIDRQYGRVSADGSLHDMFQESAKLDEIPVHYRGIYDQPAGRINQYENLNGIAEIKDVYSEVGDDVDMDGLRSEYQDDNVGYVPDRAADRSEV